MMTAEMGRLDGSVSKSVQLLISGLGLSVLSPAVNFKKKKDHRS